MVRAGRHDDAVSLFDFFFRRSNIVPNVVSYNTLILAHCEAARVDSALQVYREMLDKAPFSPSAVTYRHLTKGLVAAGRIQDALDLLREMLNRGQGADSLVYNNLIAGYIEEDNWDKAFELFEELQGRCLVYDGVVHTSFMEGYWKKGMDKEAMENYQSLLDKKFRMTPATCNVLLETLFKHDKDKEANDLWETMIDNHTPPSFIGINSESYNVMVNQCFKKCKFHEAIEVFHRQPRKNVQMDVGCFNNIIGKLCENGMLEEAEKLFEEMETKSVLPDVYTYTYLVDSCFKVGRVDDTIQYFYKMADGREHGPKFNIGFFNRMFEGLTEAGRMDDALKVYGRMPDKEIKPNTTTFETLVNALCKEGDLDKARELVSDMAKGGVTPPPEFRDSVIDIFKNAGRQEEIEKAFEEKPVPLPPQPRPEYRPHSSPQRLPGFASNQTRGSYMPHQGQPTYGSQPLHPAVGGSQAIQPQGMPLRPQQPVFGGPQVDKSEFGGRPLQHGPSAPDPRQPGFVSMTQPPNVSTPNTWQHSGVHATQGTHHGMGSPHPWQQSVGIGQVQQTDYSSGPPMQPGFGRPQPPQPMHSAPQTQQPGYGTSHPWHTRFHAPQVQQPSYGGPQSSQHAVGSTQPPQGQFGTPQAPPPSPGFRYQNRPEYGQAVDQHNRFGSPQGEPRFHTQPQQQGFDAQAPGNHALQGQNSFNARRGQVGFGNQGAPPEYGASPSQPSHGAAWNQRGYGLSEDQEDVNQQVVPHAYARDYHFGEVRRRDPGVTVPSGGLDAVWLLQYNAGHAH
uniref:Pentacotripeptide-repeat region of PRORP domain-containing protein n=2 Tax=Oryza nivara TaxID=4536 RepID=A0A0E0IUG0_ORYNI